MELMVLQANSTGSGAVKMPYNQESFGSGSYELEVEVLCWGVWQRGRFGHSEKITNRSVQFQAQKQCNQKLWAENTFVFVFCSLSKWETGSRWTDTLRTKDYIYWASRLVLPYRQSWEQFDLNIYLNIHLLISHVQFVSNLSDCCSVKHSDKSVNNTKFWFFSTLKYNKG